MGFWKGVGKFFGGVFILLGLSIFIMAYFGNYAIDNLDLIEGDFNVGDETVNEFLDNNKEELEMIEEYCKQNPDEENCKVLESPTVMAVFDNASNEDPILDTIKNEIREFRIYGDMMRLFGIVFFFLGLFLYILSEGWIVGMRNASLVSFIGATVSYLYYRYAVPGTLTSFLPNDIMDVIGNWILTSLNHTLNMVLTLGVTFLILTIVLYILHKKSLEKTSLEK